MAFVWVPALKRWVGKYEVTNGEYRKKEAGHDSKDLSGQSLNDDRQPVVFVNFDDAKAFANWLTEKEKEHLSRLRYRVISDAEWQVCAKCGTGRLYPWGPSMPPKYGNYSDSASPSTFRKIEGYSDGFSVSCPVENSGPNEWGLYGMGGNVWECCAWDVTGASFGAWRGGSFANSTPECLWCVSRSNLGGSPRNPYIGFRLVLSEPAS